MASSSPIFIVGANRSGTTLLRLMLNAHPRISIPDELVYFHPSLPADPHDWREPAMSNAEYQTFVRAFLHRNREALSPLSMASLERAILEAGTPDLRRPYETVLSTWTETHGKERWGEKTPGNLFYADVLLDMFPEAQFIYVARDPRAGVNSMMKSSLFAGDTVINALNRRKYMTKGLAHLRASVPSKQWTPLRFEDLVQAPKETLQTLCAFLREDFDDGMLSYHENAQDFMKERALSQFNTAATQPVRPEKASSWRHSLTATQIAEIEWICKPQMAEFGYQALQHPLPLRNRLMGWMTIAYWHIQNWRNRRAPAFIQQERIFNRSRILLQEKWNSLSPASP